MPRPRFTRSGASAISCPRTSRSVRAIRLAKDGSVRETLTNAEGAVGLASNGAAIFWTNPTAGTVMSFDRTETKSIATGQASPEDVAVDGAVLFWANTGGTIMTMDTAAPGATPVTLASGQGSPARSRCVGVRILEHALRSVPGGAKAPPFFHPYRASVDELRGAMARDAVCIDDMFARGQGNDERASADQSPKAPWLARRFVRADRERAMLRMQAGERLAECAATKDDGRAFVECWTRAIERDDVPSVMSRAVAVNPPPIDEALALQRDVLSR